MSPLREELIAYSQQQRSDDQVIRKLLESNTWYAPAGFVATALNRTLYDRVLHSARQEPLPVGGMVFFTDFEAAKEADLPATFAGEIAGVDLFETLDPAQINRLQINYGLPRAQTFYADADAFDLLKLWCSSIRLERQLKATAYEGGPIPFAGLRQHPGFMVAVKKANNELQTGQVKGLNGECALAFTAPDRFEEYMCGLDPHKREETAVASVSGQRLFEVLSGAGLAGVMMNVGITIPAGLFQQILAAS